MSSSLSSSSSRAMVPSRFCSATLRLVSMDAGSLVVVAITSTARSAGLHIDPVLRVRVGRAHRFLVRHPLAFAVQSKRRSSSSVGFSMPDTLASLRR